MLQRRRGLYRFKIIRHSFSEGGLHPITDLPIIASVKAVGKAFSLLNHVNSNQRT